MNTKIAATLLAISTLAAAPASSRADQAKCFKTTKVKFYSSAPSVIDATVTPTGLPKKDSVVTVETYRDGVVEYRERYKTSDTSGDGTFDIHYYQTVPMSWAGERIRTKITIRSGSCSRTIAGSAAIRSTS